MYYSTVRWNLMHRDEIFTALGLLSAALSRWPPAFDSIRPMRFPGPSRVSSYRHADTPLRTIRVVFLGCFKLRTPIVQTFLYPALKPDVARLIVTPALGQVRLWYVAAFKIVCVLVVFTFSQKLAAGTPKVFWDCQHPSLFNIFGGMFETDISPIAFRCSCKVHRSVG